MASQQRVPQPVYRIMNGQRTATMSLCHGVEFRLPVRACLADVERYLGGIASQDVA